MLSRSPLRDQVYLDLLQRVQRGAIAPGSRIRDTDIARQLGVSRTPIREALVRLRDERLVSIVPQLGTYVSRISPQAVSEIGKTDRNAFSRGNLIILVSLLGTPCHENHVHRRGRRDRRAKA